MKLQDNPFFILGASPSLGRHELFELVEMAEMLGDAQKAKAAYQSLIMPESRLAAEIRWFPGADWQMLAPVIQKIQLNGHCLPGELPAGTTFSPLARFNLMCSDWSVLSKQNPAEQLVSTSLLFERISAEDVAQTINADREGTGFDSVSSEMARDALGSYGRELALDIWNGLDKDTNGLAALMTDAAKQLQEAGDGFSNSLICEVFALYELFVADEATRCKEALIQFQQYHRTIFSRKWLRKGMRHVQRWNQLMLPARLFSALRGVPHKPTREIDRLVSEILSAMIVTRNFGVAVTCCEIRLECFGDDPKIREVAETALEQTQKAWSDMRYNAISILIIAGIGFILGIYGLLNS